MPDEIQTELAAIREAAAIAPLPHRAFLRIAGPDAARWLNGMVTNNVATLAPGEGNYNFLLNAQGRIQADCTIYREPDPAVPASFLLATDTFQLETIHHHLDHFIIMDDVELTPTLLDQTILLIAGPKSPQLLTQLGLPALDPLHLAHAAIGDRPAGVENRVPHVPILGHGLAAPPIPPGPVLLLTPTAASVPKFELRAPTATLAAIRASVTVPEVSAATLEALRILEGHPKFGQDITDKYLAQETAQTHALHFSKGCYLGQEIVERIHSRGQVHRTFTQLRLTGTLPESLPARLESPALSPNELARAAGEITSAVQIGPTLYALGYVRRELLDTHAPLTYPGGAATASNR